MKKKNKRPWGVFLAIVLAILFGSYFGKEGGLLGVTFYSIFDTIGTIFLNALTLVVVPLVSSSIITGIARVGAEGGFGRLGVKMFSFYIGTSLIAILIGLVFVNLIGPGFSQEPPVIGEQSISDLGHLKDRVGKEGQTLVNILISIVPSNILNALSKGEMLGLIFFSLIFGYCITKVESHPASILKGFFQGIFQTMIQFTHFIMKFLPYGVFCLVAKVFMVSGISSSSPSAYSFSRWSSALRSSCSLPFLSS